MEPEFSLEDLAAFIVEANKNTWASGIYSNAAAQRPGFDELEFKKGDWELRDSYCGFYRAPGQTIVRLKGKPVWNMAYDGGMIKDFSGNKQFAEQAFKFLQKALMKVDPKKPFRGPENFKENKYEYVMEVDGDITEFKGHEKILFGGKIIFAQNFMGGLILDK